MFAAAESFDRLHGVFAQNPALGQMGVDCFGIHPGERTGNNLERCLLRTVPAQVLFKIAGFDLT